MFDHAGFSHNTMDRLPKNARIGRRTSRYFPNGVLSKISGLLCRLPNVALPRRCLHRRQKLAQLIDTPVVLWSGRSSPRNFPAIPSPFAAVTSLYFAGLPLENAAIRLEAGQLTLFMDDALR